ncbi:unnamed protein product [Nezara viridula]|uniref:LITAF domain-containing protein n=1 Tax=Nezara viridula TaxID=85310 RepID=A0A9P0H622_NEZVI|nr:unnamed protein product [Nezara viridula]
MKQSKGIKVLQVRCLLCHEALRYSRDYTRPLIEHLKRRHPYINIARLPSLPDSSDRLYMRTSVEGLANPTISSYIAMEKERSWQVLESKENEQLAFDSTLKKEYTTPMPSKPWILGSGRLLCTRCGCQTDPMLEKKDSTYNSFGRTCFLLWCWPFSFMTYNFCAEKTVKLFCKKCSSYLATYDLKEKRLVHRRPFNHSRQASSVVAKLSTSAPSISIHSNSWEKVKNGQLPLSHSSIK